MNKNKRALLRADFFVYSNGVAYAKETVKVNPQKRYELFKRFNRMCNDCGIGVETHRGYVKFFGKTRLGHIDHILPIARGGKTIDNNLQLLCENCNQKKGAK